MKVGGEAFNGSQDLQASTDNITISALLRISAMRHCAGLKLLEMFFWKMTLIVLLMVQ
jgi:hypothetical protein